MFAAPTTFTTSFAIVDVEGEDEGALLISTNERPHEIAVPAPWEYCVNVLLSPVHGLDADKELSEHESFVRKVSVLLR